MPASVRTASNASVNCPARSRIRKQKSAARSPRVHQEVADLLRCPGTVRVSGDPDDVHVTAAYLYDEQAVQALQGHRADVMEEVRGEHGGCLGVHELPPGVSRHRKTRDHVERCPTASGRSQFCEAATAGQLRDTLVAISAHLGRKLDLDVAQFPAYGPDERPAWAVCQTGNAMRAGFQIYHVVIQALAGGFLAVMGFDAAQALTDPDYQAAMIVPSLASAGKARMRTILADLAGPRSRYRER
jgi:hypothetical protein